MAMTDTEKIARRIANELYSIAEGYTYRDQDDEDHDVETDGIEDVPEDWEQVTMYDYLADNLGVRYVVDEGLDYLGAIVTVAWGGPNVYIDTYERCVRVYWGADKSEWSLYGDACEAVDEVCGEWYACARA